MKIFAIDPGPEKSGICLFNTETRKVLKHGVYDNREIANGPFLGCCCDVVVFEMIQSYGMRVGKSTFETCIWIGRLMERCNGAERYEFITRPTIKTYLCGTCRGIKDADVWRAVTDLFNSDPKKAVGTKKEPGPLYGVKSHARMALAVALAWEKFENETQKCLHREGVHRQSVPRS